MENLFKYEMKMVNGDKFLVTVKHPNIKDIVELIGNIHDGMFLTADCGTCIRYRDIVSIKKY